MSRQSFKALTHDATISNELWHIRIGHLHYKALPDIQNIVCGIPSISFTKNEICKGFMLGKNIKKSFPSSDNKAQGILDLVHYDVCGSSHLPHSLVFCIMAFLLMITEENVGYISLKLKVTHLIDSNNIKPLLKSKQGNTSESLE
jgi:hypothetical protein